MNNVYDETKFLMKKYNITANKSLGQNFLVDDESIEKIVEASDLTTDDLVIEIGPGLGTLTQKLLEKAKKVIAIELDKKMIKEYGLVEIDATESIHKKQLFFRSENPFFKKKKHSCRLSMAYLCLSLCICMSSIAFPVPLHGSCQYDSCSISVVLSSELSKLTGLR